ncbi:MAG: hypothetical protein IJN39_00300, partial [Clostridia bacterium]|nr:hypothetical protein [Clostridia bacterium]
MTYQSYENSKCYFPPILSNGEIAFAADAEGMIGYTVDDYKAKDISAFDGIVVRTARRSPMCNNLTARLFPFGKFTFDEGSVLKEWSQTLNPEKGYFESDCNYSDGTKIYSKGFIHTKLNIYSLQKTFKGIKETKTVAYNVTLSGYNESISEYMNVTYTEKRNGVCCIGFKMYGMEVFCGEIRFFVDKEFDFETVENGIRISFDVKDGEAVTFYYYLEDNMNGVDYCEVLKSYEQEIEKLSFCGLLDDCIKHYKDFYSSGYVETADKKLNSIYKTSLYSIKCNTTKYSIAVGLNNGSWDGKYFAFDEYTSFLGLLSANRLELAKRVPSYRLKTCLQQAIKRASDCHRNESTEDMALFHWQTGESDKMELARDGNWLDHVFHIPLVGIGAFDYYEYSGDKEFLKECYQMIRACAKFITKHMVYRDGESLYIGKCTDLERLGSSVQNPFMTACGAIKLLECCFKAAEILGTDEEYANECRYVAKKLYESLPEENGIYVPHLNCKQKSIAVFAGKFPFDVLNNEQKLLNAWEDYEQNGAKYGNMYPTGKGISPWYACWKAEGYARAKMTDKAYQSLKQAYSSSGVFDE